MNNEIKYSQKANDRPVTLAELSGFAKGILIDIPSPISGEVIKVKVRRLDLTKDLLGKSEITNFLSIDVIEKYKDTSKSKEEIEKELEKELAKKIEENDEKTKDGIMKIVPLIDDICKEVLVEPTYQDFQNTCGLTMEMKMCLFGFAVGETQKLQSFRNGR